MSSVDTTNYCPICEARETEIHRLSTQLAAARIDAKITSERNEELTREIKRLNALVPSDALFSPNVDEDAAQQWGELTQ